MKRRSTAVMLSFLSLLGFAGAAVQAQSVGNAFPIANTPNAEMNGGAAFDGSNYLVAIQGDASNSNSISVQYVSPTGSLQGTRISVGRAGGVPRVTFDGNNYLLVWSDGSNNQVSGVFINRKGNFVGSPFPITSGTGSYEPQGLAFDGTNYLVIYSDASSGPFNLCGRFVSPAGTVADQFVLAANAYGTFQAVAWNGSTYLVAWPAHIGGNQNIVQGRTLSKTGAMSDLITIDGTISRDQNPLSVGTDGTNFLVVWNYDASVDGQGNAIWELRGRVVTPTGGFLGGYFTVADTSTRPIFPAVGFDGATYLVAWTAYNGTDFDVMGQYFNPGGTPVGSAFGIATGSGNQGLSPLLFVNGKYLAVWDDGLAFDPTYGITGGGDVMGAFLTPPLAITAQPQPQTVTAGGNAAFTVTASGNPSPNYKWQVSADSGNTWTDLTDTAPYGGRTTATLTITGVTSSLSRYQYRCVVSNSVGTVNSNGAVLRVAPTTLTFGGSDDFSSSTNWSAPTRVVGVGGALTFNNGQLEYTVNPASASDTVLREWTANVGSYTQDWMVQVQVHLASLSLGNAQHANLNLVVVKAADATNDMQQMNRMSVAIDRYGNGTTTIDDFESDLRAYYGGATYDNRSQEVQNSARNASLRITFNSTTKELTSWYTTDGTNWSSLQTVNIGSSTYTWNMSDNST
jgi:hypothetical protein